MNFRQFRTSSGKSVICGRDAEQNEEVVKLAEPAETILHTKAAGSPFCVIRGRATARDISETAIFCAIHSRDWKKNRSDTEIHVFKGRDTFKEEGMKAGTFGVRKHKKILAKKSDIEKIIK